MKANLLWATSGTAFYLLAQWTVLIVLAALTSPEMVGRFALGIAISAPVYMLVSLKLRHVISADAHDDYSLRDYLAVRVLASLVAFCIVAAIAQYGPFQKETGHVLLALGVAKGVESISDLLHGLFQRFERLSWVAASLFIKGAGSVLAVFLAVKYTGDVFWGCVGLGFVWLLVLLGFDIPRARHLARPGLRTGASGSVPAVRPGHGGWALVLATAPLGGAALLGSLGTNIPRLFVERYLGEYQLGIYAAMLYAVAAGVALCNGMGQVFLPRLASRYKRRRQGEFVQTYLLFLGGAATLGILGVTVAFLWGEGLLNLLYGTEYTAFANVFPFVMTIALIQYLVTVQTATLTAVGLFRPQFLVAMFSAITLTGACAAYVPGAGLLGAALAQNAGAAVNLLGTTYWVLWLFKRNVPGPEHR